MIAFLLYMFVLGKWSASGTSYGFVLVPLVTIVVASTLVGEEITFNFLIGAGLVYAFRKDSGVFSLTVTFCDDLADLGVFVAAADTGDHSGPAEAAEADVAL